MHIFLKTSVKELNDVWFKLVETSRAKAEESLTLIKDKTV